LVPFFAATDTASSPKSWLQWGRERALAELLL